MGIYCILMFEATTNEGILYVKGLSQHPWIDRSHVVPMNPNLAHLHVGGPLTLYFRRRGPHMLRKVAQSGGCGAIRLEDSWIAKEDRYGDSQE